MNTHQILAWLEQQARHYRSRQLSVNPASQLAIYNYDRGKFEAYSDCANLIRELAAKEES